MVARAKKSVAVAPVDGVVFSVPQMIKLDLIDFLPQVRTKINQASLVELAADFRALGFLQPVLLRPPVEGRYPLIAGERRIRAARIAGLSAVPALIGDVTDEQAEDMQFAENIQREDLSLQDEARGIRRRYDRLGKIELVAARVRKSVAWVSKRLSLTYDDFDWRARKLLEDGVTEDVELLQCVAKVAALDQSEASALDRAVRDGKAGRKEARAVLAKLKKKPVASAKPGAVGDESVESAGESSGPGVRSQPAFDGRVVLWDLVEEMRSEGCRAVADMVAEFDEDQQAAVLAIARNDYECGVAMVGCDALDVVRRVGGMNAVEHLEDWSIAAFTLGAFGMPFELGSLLLEVRATLP